MILTSQTTCHLFNWIQSFQLPRQTIVWSNISRLQTAHKRNMQGVVGEDKMRSDALKASFN
jgi:hypothetical protein